MNERNARYNSLTRGQILPPPFSYNLNNNTSRKANTRVTTPSSLLHQAYASCGRVFCVCLLLLSTIVFVACGSDEQQEDYASIEDPISLLIPYYLESKGLPETSADSIVRFVHKFGDYVKANPACRGDEYYQPTYDNMVYAGSLFGLTITTVTSGIKLETDWFGGYEVNF